MSYAAALMVMGWFRYGRANPLAPVFTVCGTVLMFTIIGETHARFGALPSVPAYILLMLTGLGTAVISYVHRAPAPVAVGNLGMCIAGAAIDYPTPFFPYLGIVLLTANLLGYFTARAHRYSWLRWILLLVTLFMIHLWGFKLGMTLLGGEKPPRALAPAWFLPLLTLFTATYMITAFLGIVRSLPGKISRFELALPTINVAWAFLLAQYVVSAMGGSNMLLGAVGVIAGVGHLAAAYWLAGRDPKGARGTNAFLFAGAVLLALTLPVATRQHLPVAPASGGGCPRGSSDVGKVAQRKRSADVVPPANVCGRCAGSGTARPGSNVIRLVTCCCQPAELPAWVLSSTGGAAAGSRPKSRPFSSGSIKATSVPSRFYWLP